MAIGPEELERQANQILREKPVGLLGDQPGIVGLDDASASAAFNLEDNTAPQIGDVPFLRAQVQDVIQPLTEIERSALSLRFGLKDGVKRSFAQMGDALNVHRTTASRAVTRGLHKLRYPSPLR